MSGDGMTREWHRPVDAESAAPVSSPSRRDTPSTPETNVGELVHRAYDRVAENVQRVIQGKPEAVRLAVVCLLVEGHLLIEDVPGLGKTSLARCIARSVQASWRRIQFTPDLLPSDVTGVMIFNQGTSRFEFHEGAVFANVVLADEINRATPKTQSALLEVMEEQRVTVDGVPHHVPRPFIVVATQNPIDMDGTYRLPEAQLDRFLMRISIGYPNHDAEVRVLDGERVGISPDQLQPVLSLSDLQRLIALARSVRVDPAVASYAVRLAAATRQHVDIRLGASPRGSIGLIKVARGWAATDGRDYVTPDDIKAIAQPVLAHRLMLTPEAEIRGGRASDAIDAVLRQVAVPTANAAGVGR